MATPCDSGLDPTTRIEPSHVTLISTRCSRRVQRRFSLPPSRNIPCELHENSFSLSTQSPPSPLRAPATVRDPSRPSHRMSSSRDPPKEKTHWCSCDRCHGGKRVSRATYYNHGNSVKRSSQSFSQQTVDLILSLPQTSKSPRTRRPRKRRAEEAVSADEDPLEGSKRATRSDSVCVGSDTQCMRLGLSNAHGICI